MCPFCIFGTYTIGTIFLITHETIFIMNVLSKIGSLLERFNFLFPNEELYLHILFRLKMGRKLDIHNPKTFSEKLQWLKLYNRKNEYTVMVDKAEVKDYVKNIIGAEYIIPTLFVCDTPDDIEWDKLPDRFVLKTTHGGGGTGVVVCKDKISFDYRKAIKRLRYSMRVSGYNRLKEWPYKNVKRRVIVEKYLEDSSSKQLADYKFWCFNGEPKLIMFAKNRNEDIGMTIDFFTTDWVHMDVKRRSAPNSVDLIPEPSMLKEMLVIARKLSADIPFVRIDLYQVDNRIYFGEYTFFAASGLKCFVPDKWDSILGSWLVLPDKE